MMPHGKSFLHGLSGIVQGRLGWAGQEMQAFCPQIEEIITASDWLRDQEFDTIHYVMRFGAEKLNRIECRKRRRYQELEVASVESMETLHRVCLDRPLLRAFLAVEVKRVMHHVAEKYQLPRLPDLDAHLDQQINQAEQVGGEQPATRPESK
jgi:hypothetical protein